MKPILGRMAKPMAFVAVAIVATASFVAASPEGYATVKAALGGITGAAHSSCHAGKTMASMNGECPMRNAKRSGLQARKNTNDVKLASATAGGTCCEGSKTASAKDAAAAGNLPTCPMGAKGTSVTPAVEKSTNAECPYLKHIAETAADHGDACCAGKDILNVAMADAEFSTFVLAAKASGAIDALQSPEAKTVFAPTNDAFRKLSPETFAALLQQPEKMRALLTRHIVPGVVKADDLKKLTAAKLGDAKVTRADIAASNGMIHAIDTVLLPETETASVTPTRSDELKVAQAK